MAWWLKITRPLVLHRVAVLRKPLSAYKVKEEDGNGK
jgi:hypothetical protein